MKRIISFVLSAALIFSAMFITPSYASAYDGVADTAAVRQAVQMFNPSPDMAVYSDEFFKGNSLQYNRSLSTWSFEICNTTLDSANADKGDRSKLLRIHLEDNGFTDFEINEDFRNGPSAESAAAACAHKTIKDNGKDYTLLAVIPRSGTAAVEFARTIKESDSADDIGDHAGYRAAADKIAVFVNNYVKDHGIKGDVKVWVTGYSGGAGIADIFCADFLRDPSKVLGNSVSFSPDNFYAYIFSPLKVASKEKEQPAESDLQHIHVVYEKSDILAVVPFAADFGRYGTEHYYSEIGSKDRMLELLKTDDEELYNSYIVNQDPDDFAPYKLDISKIMKGKIEVVPDDDSYIPADQAAYMEAVAGALKELAVDASKSGDAREGYFSVYQGAIERFMEGTASNRMDILSGMIAETKTSIPMIISMYMTTLVERSKAHDNEIIRESFEGAFNYIASQIENSDGSIKDAYRLPMNGYKLLRGNLFEKAENGSYALKGNVDLKKMSILLPTMKKLDARLYAATLRAVLEKKGMDANTITALTSDADSEAMTELVRTLLFVDTLQSGRAEPFSFNNQQFKHLATLYGNINRYLSSHMYRYVIEWMRAADPYFDDYKPLDSAQITAYRRVYINAPGGNDFKATVEDAGGNTAAVFRDGRIVSRTDEWIGYTASDNGGWLRLPLDKSYKVRISTAGKSVDVKVAEFAISEGKEVRATTFRDKKGGGILSLPAAKPEGGEYSLPTNLSYSMSMDEKLKKSLPALKSFKAAAGKNSLKAGWKKLSKSKAASVDLIELQYSTARSFTYSKTVTRELAKNRTSVKIKKLKKGRTYYVRIRTAEYSAGMKYVSKWSAVKKLKVK